MKHVPILMLMTLCLFALPATAALPSGSAQADSAVVKRILQAGRTLAATGGAGPDVLVGGHTNEHRIEAVTLPVQGATLVGRLYIPAGDGQHPAILMLPGARDSQNLCGLAEYLAGRGIAVLDLNKRGVGGSTGSWKMSFNRRTADALAGIELLRSHPEIASDRIGVMGHSQGGWIAQMLGARSPDVRFAVLLAAPAQTVFDQILTYERIQLERSGTDPADVDQAVRRLRRQLRMLSRVDGPCRMLKLHYVCFMLDHDPAPFLSDLRIPVLALFGQIDPMTPPQPNVETLAVALEAAGNADLSIHVFPEANHDFRRGRTGLVAEYHLLEPDYVPGFLPMIANWIIDRAEESGIRSPVVERKTKVEEMAGDQYFNLSRSSRVVFSSGLAHLAHQDLIHTPFVHGGVSAISFGISYSRKGNRWAHFAEGRYSAFTSRLGDPFEVSHGDHGHDNPPHGYLLFEFAYGAGRFLASNASRSAAAGGSVRFDLQGVFYNYGGEENFGYFLSPSLNVWYEESRRIGRRHEIGGRVEAPLVSWVARSPYMVNDDRFIENVASDSRLKSILAFLADGSPATWDRLQRVHVAADYGYAFSARFSAGVSYRFAFLRSTEPRPLISYQNTLNLTTSIRF